MNDISCPHCGKAFKIDEAGYASILKQVRNSEFDAQLQERLALAEREKRSAIELATSQLAQEAQKTVTVKDTEIQELKARLDAGDVAQRLAVAEALSAVEKQRDALANQLEQARQERHAAAQLAEVTLLNALQNSEAAKEAEIQRLTAQLATNAVDV